MELRQLAAFRAVATSGSVTRAAATLNYVQSSVTAQVQALETDLGVPLFDRPGRRVVLTEAGRRLLPYAERLLETVTEAREAVTGGGPPSGTIRISAPESLCTYRLPALLLRCRERYPEIDLVFQPGVSARLLDEVRGGAIDLAFLLDEPRSAPSVEVESLACERLVVVAVPGDPLVERGVVTLDDLGRQPMLLTETGCSYRLLFLRHLAEAGIRPAQLLEFGSVEAIKQCVLAGMGITVLPAFVVAAELADGRLAEVAWPGPDLTMTMQMAWHGGRWLSPALDSVLRLARAMLAPDTGSTTPPG